MADLNLLAALELVAAHAARHVDTRDHPPNYVVREWCALQARIIRAERARMVRLAQALLEDTIELNHASDDEMHEFAIRARRLVREFDIVDAEVVEDDQPCAHEHTFDGRCGDCGKCPSHDEGDDRG